MSIVRGMVSQIDGARPIAVHLIDFVVAISIADKGDFACRWRCWRRQSDDHNLRHECLAAGWI